MKKIVILGSSGSIGENTLSVVSSLPEHFEVIGLAVNRNYGRALEQAQHYGVTDLAVADPEAAARCRRAAPSGTNVRVGSSGVTQLAALDDADIVVCALVGIAGLEPVMAAAGRGTDIALATKEVLVAAGEIVAKTCARSGSQLLPVDSEHSAIFQCLAGRAPGAGICPTSVKDRHADLSRIILTASGGPFGWDRGVDMDTVTVEQALNHPRWEMGPKVTIDSATLMNKGLEIMEARWLFNMPVEKIGVVLHRESIVHSLVEFVDGSVMAQLGQPDMRMPIQYALTYPERVAGGLPHMDLAELGALHFAEPDEARFPCLRLARAAESAGGTMPAVLNGANEVAVDAFLNRQIQFSGIWHVVESVMQIHEVETGSSLEGIIAADEWARAAAEAACRDAGRHHR